MDFLNQITNDKQFTSLSKEVQEHILKYGKLAVGINTKIANERLPVTSSKFGGTPYLASNEQLPRDKENRPYLLLVQLNFAEIKQKVGQHPQLPSEGLLQIFIPAFEENHGCLDENYNDINGQIVRFITNFTDDMNKADIADYNDMFYNAKDFIDKKKEVRDKHFKCNYDKPNYYEKLDELINDLPFAKKFGIPWFPIYEEHELEFVPLLTRISESSAGFRSNLKLSNEKLHQEEDDYLNNNGTHHTLLGFPRGFVQGDPRYGCYYPNTAPEEFKQFIVEDTGDTDIFRTDILSFLDLESTNNMDWWGMGKAHFLIQEDDLKAFNFQNMEYCIQST